MNDLLYVSYDNDDSYSGLCVGRPNPDGSHTILKLELGEHADNLYHIIKDRESSKLDDEQALCMAERLKAYCEEREDCEGCQFQVNGNHVGCKIAFPVGRWTLDAGEQEEETE